MTRYTTTRGRLLLVLAAVLMWPATGLARTPDRDTVELVLSSHERIPSRSELLRLGPGVEAVLHRIVEHPSRRALARNRALTVLRQFPSKATRALLARQIQRTRRHTRPGVELLDLQQAVTSYAVVAGAKALPVCRALLSHPQPDVRTAAATAVRRTRSPKAANVLDKRLQIEPSAMVRAELRQQLRVLRRPPERPR